MDNRIMRLIIALGKFSAQPRQYRIMEGLNASETGVFWAMTQIIAEKPDTELFGLSELNSYLNFAVALPFSVSLIYVTLLSSLRTTLST